MAKGLGVTLPALLLLVASAAQASLPSESRLRRELQQMKGRDFSSLLSEWNKNFGPAAMAPLLKLASDRKLEDHQRYVALMAAARLGGAAAVTPVSRFLSDECWMLRSAALRALSYLDKPVPNSGAILKLLRDPALVVRTEAVETIRKLRPPGSTEALLDAVEDPRNYHAGKAQWVPQHALAALAELPTPPSALPRIQKLLSPSFSKDPSLQRSARETLKALSAR